MQRLPIEYHHYYIHEYNIYTYMIRLYYIIILLFHVCLVYVSHIVCVLFLETWQKVCTGAGGRHKEEENVEKAAARRINPREHLFDFNKPNWVNWLKYNIVYQMNAHAKHKAECGNEHSAWHEYRISICMIKHTHTRRVSCGHPRILRSAFALILWFECGMFATFL